MANEITSALLKALEAGNTNAAPSTLVQGASLQAEDLSSTMKVVTFDNAQIKLQKKLKVETCKSLLAQFNRQLSYGIFGGSATFEGNVGQEEDSQYARIAVPMAFYSHLRRVTVPANMVATVDGTKAEDRVATDAAKKLAGDIEFDLFRGKADFSNAGVFDGNMLAISVLPNMLGLDAQIRMSDSERNAQDQMFAEYGSSDSVVIGVGGTLTQDSVEDAHVRSVMNHGEADELLVDPKVLSAYNKISFGKERIILAGSPQDATGADLRRQWVSGGVVKVEASRFLSGKTSPAAPRASAPPAPTISVSNAGGTSALAAGVYIYKVTACNELGESLASAIATTASITAGDQVTVAITPPGSGTVRFYNVYRTNAGAPAATARFIGRIAAAGSPTNFIDIGNKKPGFVTGFLWQSDSMAIKELAPYSRQKMAITDLSLTEAHYRFCCLSVYLPRFNVLLDSLLGSF